MVPPGDVDAYVAVVGEILDDREFATALGAAGRRRAETDFVLADYCRRVQDVYDEVLI
jgi:glycosyltransferase involved in cell wall biosynthesis